MKRIVAIALLAACWVLCSSRAVTAARSLPATDDCNGSIGALSGNWTVIGNWSYTGSGTCLGNGSVTHGVAKWTADSFSNNQYAQAVSVSTNVFGGVGVRMGGTTSSNITGYSWVVQQGTSQSYLIAWDGVGSYSALASVTAHSNAAGDLIKLQIVGSVITYYAGAYSDTYTITGGDPVYSSGAAAIVVCVTSCTGLLDDFQADDVGGGGPPSALPAIINNPIRGGGGWSFTHPQVSRR